jgi:tetratricopeptide (TPR) repeat protein
LDALGTPPEDEAGGAAESGAVPVPIDSIEAAKSDSAAIDRAAALAARIDAAMANGEDDGKGEVASIDLEMLEDDEPDEAAESSAPSHVVVPPKISPPRAVPPPPPRGVIAIPPPRPSQPGTPRTVQIPRVGAAPATPTSPIPVVSVPPLAPGDSHAAPPPAVGRTPTGDRDRGQHGGTREDRPRRPSAPPPVPDAQERARRISQPPPIPGAIPTPIGADDMLSGSPDIGSLDGGVEVSTGTPNIVVEQPLDAQIEHPTVVDKAIDGLGESGAEPRADAMTRELDSLVLSDPGGAAMLAYELGELYERRLADEARAVKAFGRALGLDPSLRPNLWAIRRVFYRRALWPNLVKLVDAEVAYARDDLERADLLLEKARISAHHMNQLADARASLDEAVRIAPQHQGALLELERVLAAQNDAPALREVWELLAEAAEQPSRKVGYWLEVGRAAGAAREVGRAQEAFDRAAALATGAEAERVARERLRAVEQADGGTADVVAAIDSLATVLLATFGPAGPATDAMASAVGERPDRATALRLELVALRRRQAQLARADQPDRAWELLQQASALAPGESMVLSDLTELAEELGRYDDLAELVQSWQAVEADPSRGLILSIRRADALLRGGQGDQARALLASLEATAPGFIVLTSAAERDALARKDPGELAKTYIAGAHAALLGTWLGPGHAPQPDPAAAAALFVQGAELIAYESAGTASDAYNDARTALGKALEAVPNHPAAIEALIELDDAFGHAGDALARLRGLIDDAQGTAKRPLVERAIRIARGHGDLEAMLAFERELAALVPDDTVLAWRLESTLAQLGKDDERGELLAALGKRETDATRKGTALFAAARLRERAGAVEDATELYRQVLAIWPDDTFARESLVDLLRAQERWAELVAERRAEAIARPDGPAARRALREAAWVLEVRLGDPATASTVYAEWLARTPDDRIALEGLARTRAAAGDHRGEAEARRTLAESDPNPDTQWLLGKTLESAGQLDDAADQYRALIAQAGDPTVASTAAALALGDLAAARHDTVMRVEATAALAGKTTDRQLGAALAEEGGWMYALVLEDFDRAAQSFQASIELSTALGARRGALLGAALVAAKRSDPQVLAQAYEGLAATVQMPEAAAALLLRAAAMAAADGDLDTANARVAAARIAAPDDASALLVLAETGALPQVDADDAFAAVDPLLARAEVLEMRAALADDPNARAAWELDRAEALELAGRLREAGSVIAAVLKQRPDDLRALAALRRMAKRAGDKATAAQASFALARVLGDNHAKLELLHDAVTVFDGPPGIARNVDYAVATYKRILALDPGAPELERLLELLRERADVRSLIAALTDRLTWLDNEGFDTTSPDGSDPLAPLLLERATVLHGLGDQPAAMQDLDVLLERSPNHLEALRFRADLALTAGDAELAVSLWRRYLQHETRPQRKAEIELQLSQVLAENTGDLAGAIEQLERVVQTNPDDPHLRDQLLGLCTRANDWERALRELRQLVRMRNTGQDKAREELRIGQLLRDRVGDRNAARLAFDRARAFDPLNLDVVRELADLLEPTPRAAMLGATASSLRGAVAQSPRLHALYERLAQIHAWQADVDARWVALVAVEALGNPTADQRQVLTSGRQALGAPTKGKLDDAARDVLRGTYRGPLADLWRAIAPSVQVATGVDAVKLGFTRGDRIAQKKLGTQYDSLATILGAFALDDVEIYISAGRTGFARGLAGETPMLCLGADIAAAKSPTQRFALGRAVAHIAEGIAPLAELHDRELAWTLVAALQAAEVRVPPTLLELAADQDAAVAERTKILKKQMSRKARSTVQQIAQKPNELFAFDTMRLAAVAVGQRAGLLWSGDLAVALSVLDVGKGGRALIDSPTALDLVAWSVSEEHVKLRAKLGIALAGLR